MTFLHTAHMGHKTHNTRQIFTIQLYLQRILHVLYILPVLYFKIVEEIYEAENRLSYFPAADRISKANEWDKAYTFMYNR